MAKAGTRWVHDQLVMSANVARRVDPQLARIYYVQMVERGAHHNKAVRIVASQPSVPSASSFRQIHEEFEGAVVLHRYDSCDAGRLDGVVGHHDRHVRQKNEAGVGLLVLECDGH